MGLNIVISPEVEAALRADAESEGRAPGELANEALRARFVGPKATTTATNAGRAALAEPRHTLEEADTRHRLIFGLPDLSNLTREELIEYAEGALAAADPAHASEAERAGLL